MRTSTQPQDVTYFAKASSEHASTTHITSSCVQDTFAAEVRQYPPAKLRTFERDVVNAYKDELSARYAHAAVPITRDATMAGARVTNGT